MAIRSWRTDHLTRESIAFSIRVVALACLSFLLWVAVAALWSSTADAAPAAPIEITLEQPGGETFPAQRFGDEWNNGFETLNGFTIVRDRESGTWEYAVDGPQGTLEPSGKAVGLDAPPNIQKHLRSETSSDPQAPEQAPALESPALANPNIGTQRSLVLLVQFPDQAAVGSTAAQWNSKFFGATNSVQDYYDEVSYGQLAIAPATESHGTANDGVVGWLTMGTNHPNTAGNTGTANRTLVRDAVIAADPNVNYASYDSNGDGFLSSRELHVTVIVAGQEAAGWSHLGKSVWGHAWSLFGTERPTVDGVVFGDSGHGGGYTQFGEWHGDHMATIGIMVHEMGHDLYLPDLYDTNVADGTSEGVGNWSVMGGGTWLAVSGTHQGSTPAHLDAWSKSYEGWLTPQRLGGTQAIAQAETNATAIQLRDNPGGVDWTFNTSSGTGEYFLVENRQRVGYDAALPGCGLLVWHIDETRTSSNSANADETRRLVDLEEADGLNHLDGTGNRGDAGDPYPGTSNNTQFNDTSNPNSRLYSGSSSGVASESMTGPCSSTMSATLTDPGVGQRPANDNLAGAQGLTGASVTVTGTNVAATRESGEPDHWPPGGSVGEHSVWYSWTAPFSGQVNMDTCTNNFDTVLAVYTGSSFGTMSQVASDDDACAPGSQLSFNATAGTTYRIAVSGYFANSEGTFTLKLSPPPPANDNFASAQLLSGFSASADGRNAGATLQSGDPTAVDTRTTSHTVWYRWTAPFSGAVEMNLCTSDYDTLLGVYTGSALGSLTEVAANDDTSGCGASNAASKVTFNATQNTTYQILVDGFNGQQGTFTLRVIDKTPPKVTGTNPANNATGVAPGANVIATFSEAMDAITTDGDPSTITSTTFKLKKAGTTTFLGATVTYDPATKKATLNPNNNLQSGATYVATVTTGAQDLVGNSLDQNATTAGTQPKNWKFTVG